MNADQIKSLPDALLRVLHNARLERAGYLGAEYANATDETTQRTRLLFGSPAHRIHCDGLYADILSNREEAHLLLDELLRRAVMTGYAEGYLDADSGVDPKFGDQIRAAGEEVATAVVGA